MSKTNPWLTFYKPNPSARVRLFCFPYAGGSATLFRTWAQKLPPSVEVCPVQLPGRGGRMLEPPYTKMQPLVEALGGALTPYLNLPYAFFGHSMGAIIGYEIALYLRGKSLPQPSHLFASGRTAPHIPESEPYDYDLPEPEFIEAVKRLDGTPQEVLEHPELMNLMIPLLRADFELIQTYRYMPQQPLACPITTFGGVDDVEVSREDLESWREHTRAEFRMQIFPGGHFFIHTAETPVLHIVARELERLAAIPA